MLDTVLHIDTEILNLIGGVIVSSILVPLVTKWESTSNVKILAMLVLSLITAFCTLGLGPDGIRVGDYVASALEIIGAAILSYRVTKPNLAAVVARKTADIGIGDTSGYKHAA